MRDKYRAGKSLSLIIPTKALALKKDHHSKLKKLALEIYNQKRNFKETSEPEGKSVKEGKKHIFVVQRHHASHLHYDFRLELSGTLKSWAVPKGPSMNPKDRRLAMMVEDHPVSYAVFEGDIPEGNYGAGHVDVWDHGTYEPVNEQGEVISFGDFYKALLAGSLKFRMHGKHLKGEFALVKMQRDKKSWLLIKHRDDYATDEIYTSEDFAKKTSLAYTEKRAGAKVPAKKSSPEKKPAIPKQKENTKENLSDGKFKKFIKPMLAKLHDGPFNDPNWIFEIKWDGYRAVAEINGGKAKLYSRNGLSFEDDYPVIFKALQYLGINAILDGEIVGLDEEGLPSFQLLQNEGKKAGTLCYYVFDLLCLNGESVEDKPLIERKELLKALLPENDLVRYCDHIPEKGKEFFKLMQARGMEGMIAKNSRSVYTEGGRTPDWLKVKHILTDEAVICGYTAPKGKRTYFGALVLGAYKAGKLDYIGHTGTGFDQQTLKELHDIMQPLIIDYNPFGKKIPVNAAVTWLEPTLVANIKFTERTDIGILRHPVYSGLRKDKSASEVTGADAAVPEKKPEMDTTKKISGHAVTLTNTQKVWWPEEGYTKGDVLAYYEGVAKYMLKYLKGRPLSLKRNPNGITDHGFFHKDAGDNAPDWVDTKTIHSDSTGNDVDYIVCNNKATLIYLANLGCIEMNPWHSTTGDLEHPDYLIMDLDPADKNTFEQVIDTANAVKEVLDGAGATSFVKTSGSTGLHIYVPLGSKYSYEQSNAFAEIIATRTNSLVPGFTSLERSLKKRGNNIYIDFMQNNIGQTVAAAYSLRPKPHAPVSTPLEWKEVKKGLSIEQFNITNTFKRLEKIGDLFAGLLTKKTDMMKALKKLGA